MEPIRISPYMLILFGAIAGFLLGLIPLILGVIKKRAKYGILGLVSSIIGGAILGIFLIVPVVAVFTWLILKKPNPQMPNEVVIVNENPVKVEIDNSENR